MEENDSLEVSKNRTKKIKFVIAGVSMLLLVFNWVAMAEILAYLQSGMNYSKVK